MIKLPLIAILAVNVVLITCYEFLVTVGCIGVVIMIAVEFIEYRWKMLALLLEIAIAILMVACFINAYATGRVNPLRY